MCPKVKLILFAIIISLPGCLCAVTAATAEVVKFGLNFPRTGPYSIQGLDQWRAAKMAAEEINKAGGIMGNHIQIVSRDSKSNADLTTKNVTEMIFEDNVKMVFGGSASSVAIAAGKVCEQNNVLFFGTLTYSTATTGKEGRRHVFRECYNSWMGAKVIASYLKTRFRNKKYFYITADYTWGWTTEASVRKFSRTENTSIHKGLKTKFPGATEKDFKDVLQIVKREKPNVLVLVLFGKDMTTAVRQATAMGLKKRMQIVVPNLTLGMAEGAGAEVMEGVIGALPWTWKVPYKYDYSQGIKFVEDFAKKYNRYPSTSGASAYTILYEYKSAVERAGTFDTAAVIKALEGHEYSLLKDKQIWRKFDHQSVQTIYAIRCNSAEQVMKDKYKLDFFDIIGSIPGVLAARTRVQWSEVRRKAGKPAVLAKLPGE
ncbi:MAG: ABC transporter substrate-binding protein [Desulfobacteraceae bacterium]|nr:ABC transporter substrate-binding protein [Desulfobacteraceae bacterium]